MKETKETNAKRMKKTVEQKKGRNKRTKENPEKTGSKCLK